MKYKPKPIDTSGVKLPKGLHKLTEKLSENNHDLWALQRISESWTYGPKRNDAKKTHPDLIPYAKLSKSEKEYDRITAMEALKAIVALGYRIEPPVLGKSTTPSSVPQIIREAVALLKRTEDLDLKELLAIWKRVPAEHWEGSPKIYELLGSRIQDKGEPILAYDVISSGLKFRSKNVRLRQLLGLALADSGATEKAQEELTKLYDEGKLSGETLGILARTHKDLWSMEKSRAKKINQLEKAFLYYHIGYRQSLGAKKRTWLDGAIYTGVNAATMALLMGEKDKSRRLARDVQKLSLKKLKKDKRDYWALASLGETAILLGNFKEAEERYSQAAELGKGKYRRLSTTRRQARLLLDHVGEDKIRFDHCFSIPRVVVFAGHMIDQPERHQPRFPLALEKKVGQEISNRLKKLDVGFAYSSAACGSDILFLESMLRRKGEINVVLPIPVDDFQRASVDIIPGISFGRRYKKILKCSTNTIVASEHATSGNNTLYEYANLMLGGLALLRARTLDTDIVPMVVWDGRPGDGPGGTANFVKHWRSFGLEPEVIDIGGLGSETQEIRSSQKAGKSVSKRRQIKTEDSPNLRQTIHAMIIADVAGYSRLTEEQVPKFLDHFMGTVACLVERFPVKPLWRNTWGDSLYFVFSSVLDVGNFALELRDAICGFPWGKNGLPEDLNLRIALHAGPVYYSLDPVIQKKKITGTHVSRTARIEPITPLGQVYASQAFAALAAAQRINEFTCDYVGRTPLPKKEGVVPLYLVRKNMSKGSQKK